jgi:hypothetical protein
MVVRRIEKTELREGVELIRKARGNPFHHYLRASRAVRSHECCSQGMAVIVEIPVDKLVNTSQCEL